MKSESELLHSMWRLYGNSLGLLCRLHFKVKLRKKNAMFIAERFIPKEGKILDIGCGHGIFCNLLAETSPNREVLGIDIDKTKIGIARSSLGERLGINFRDVDVAEVNEQFDVVVVYDVIHHIAAPFQLSFLRECHKRLKGDGLLVIKDVNKKYFIRYFLFCYMVDTINAVLGITKGTGRAFLDKDELLTLVSKLNFRDLRLEEINNRDITPHLILTARKGL